MIPVKYIGHRTNFVESIYGTGIAFEQGQTVNVEDDAIARKMLKHADVYVLGEEADAETVANANPAKMTKPTDDPDPDQTVRDSIANMGKAALVDYAKVHFQADLDKRMSVGDMRTKVTGLFDQFGVGE